MSKVYFVPIADFANAEAVCKASYNLVKRLVADEGMDLPKIMPLKVHFGERGNVTFLKPNNYDGVKKFLAEKGIETCYIETNVLYKGSRTATGDHIETARAHGFVDLPIVIADGDTDNCYDEVVINKRHYKSCKIGTKFANYDGFMVLAHFKGHGSAGFGGALKQLSMGFASRGGKLHQHSDNVPTISKTRCTACGLCVDKCPTNAISIDKTAVIDKELCIGCAACSGVCPFNAIANDWGSTNFLEKMAEYAIAASLGKQNIYVNFAGSIASDCDCAGRPLQIVSSDIGVLVSVDPVAVDTATIDLIDKACGKPMFTDGRVTLRYAQELGLGKMKYNLVTLKS